MLHMREKTVIHTRWVGIESTGNLFKKILVFMVATICTLSIFASPVAFANPEGGAVAAGNATISSPDANTVIINQTSDRAVINWQTFNINQNQATHFQQPSASSITVNRVNPNNGASTIGGRLTANGQIWILNPAGVLITPTARIDVAGFLATTAGISDADFMSGNYNFVQSPDWNGAVVNQGVITVADHGMAALVAPAVSNSGVIQANLGVVTLAASNEFTVDFYGDQLINFGLNTKVTKRAVDANGKEMEDAVSNSGKIIANGGKVVMTASTAMGVVRNVVNMSGVVVAKTASVRNGVIVLGGSGGNVRVTGKLIATGKRAGEKGGTIKVTGDTVMIADRARLDARGYSGGGQILIGGNAHGAGPEKNADYAFLGKNAVADASAIVSGNGGKVILWSDYGTGYYGNIYARGGSRSGNGGFVETSGKAYLDSSGMVYADAPNGRSGQWLLDPYNVTIAAATTNGGFSGGDPDTFTPTANSATINVATINASLNAGTGVTVNTGAGGAQAGTITLTNAILKSLGATTATLTLDAAGSIVLNNNITASSGGLNVILIAPTITIGSTAASAITTNGGDFTGTATDAFTIGSGAIIGSINAGGGTVSIAANADGLGAQSFAMTANSTIATTNTSANAVRINVNAAAGGTGTAAIAGITTGSGGTVTVATNTGGNATGGSITSVGTNRINVGTGTVSLLSSLAAARAIGTSGTNMLISAGTLNAATGSGGLFINNAGTGTLALGTVSSLGAFTLTSTASAGISQINPLAVTTAATFVAGSTQDITLNNATNSVATLAVTSGRNVSYVNAGALILGASTISGTSNITAGNSITQSGVLSIAGTPTFTLSTATTNISLATQANNFSTTPVITNNGNVQDLLIRNINVAAAVPTLPTALRNLTLTFNNATALALPAMTITGSLSATANGPITQTGAISVNTLAQTATFAAGAANNITLNNPGNAFRTISFTSGNNVSLQSATGLALGASTISGTLNVVANGAVTNSAALLVNGLATFSTGAANALSLNNAGNNFSTVRVNNAAAVTIVDANSLILDTSTISGALTVTANGAISQSGALSVAGVATFAAGAANNITLDTFINTMASPRFTTGNNIKLLNSGALSLGASTVSGALTVTAGGSISQSAVLNVTGTPTFTLTSPSTDISLASQANNFVTTPIVTNNGNVRDVLLRNTNAAAAVPSLPTGLRNLTLTFNNATSLVLPAATLTGNLSATANGAITQSGMLIVPGIATLAAGAANNITLANLSNNFGSITISNGNNVSITDTDALIIAGATVSGAFNLTTGGALTQSAVISAAAGLTTINANNNNITLSTTTNNFNSIKVTSGNNVNIADANATVYDGIVAGGTLTLRTAGAMTQTGALSAVGLTSLTAGAAGNITLGDASNNLASVSVVSGNNVLLANSLGLNLAASTVSGTLNVTAGGSITQSGILTVTGVPTFTTTAANSDVLLASQANIFSATPVFTNNGNIRDIALRNTSATAAVPILPTGLRNLTLTFNAASINMLATALTGSLSLITNGTVTQSGELSGTVLTVKTLNNAGRAVTLTNAGNDFTSIDIRARNGADSANAAGALRYTDVNGFNVASLASTSTLGLIAGGAITQSGAIAGTIFTAKTLNNTGADILLTNAGNVVTNIDLRARNAADTANTAGVISYRQSGALSVAQVATASAANLTATGAITQTGAIAASTLSAKVLNNTGAAVTLSNLGNAVTAVDLRVRNVADTANTAGAISYVDADGFDVAGLATTSTISLIGSGIITQSGAAAGTTLTAKTLANAGAAITLTNTGNALTGISLRSRNLADTANAAGALSYRDVDGFNIVLLGTTGAINLIGGGAITQTGAISGAGFTAKTLNDTGAAITLATATNAVTSIDLRARNVADTTNTAGAISFTKAGALSVAQIATTSTANLIATGAITQTGAIAASTLSARTLINAGAAITLTNAGNAVSAIDLRSRNGANTANASGAISYFDLNGFDVASIATTNTIGLTAGGTITQSGAIAGGVLTVKTLNDPGAAISLTNAGNVVTNIDLRARNSADTANAAGVISYRQSGALSVAQIATASAANLTATGAITQTGAIAASTLSAKVLNNSGAAITLTNAGNAVTAVDLRVRNAADTANTSGAITYTDVDGFDVAGIATTNTIGLIAGGAMTQSGAIVGGALTARTLSNIGAAISFTNTDNAVTSINLFSRNAANTVNAAGAISFTGAGALSVAQVATTNTVGLIATGAITQTGSIAGSGLIAKTLNNAGSAITLTNAANSVASIDLRARNAADTANVAGALSYTNTGALSVAQLATTSAVNLIATGAMTQAGVISTSSLIAKTLNNAGANIVFNDSANQVASVSLQSRNLADSADAVGNITFGNASNTSLASIRTAGNASITANGTIADNGTLVVAGTLTTNSVGGVTLNNANQVNGLSMVNSGGGNVDISNNALSLSLVNINQSGGGDITIANTNNISLPGGASVVSDGGAIALAVAAGVLAIGNGASINSNGGELALTATDLNLNASGSLNSGAGGINITQNTAFGSIGLGNAVGTMSISGGELSRIGANTLTLVAASNGRIIVDGVSAAQSNNVNNVVFSATTGTLADIIFQNADSSFRALTANSNNGIAVGVNVTTTVGGMNLNADANGSVGTNDQLLLSANLISAGQLTLSAENGGVLLGSAVALTGAGITINHDVNGAQDLTLNAGSSGNIIFNANVGNLTPIQNMVIANANNVTGNIDVDSLSIGTNFANLTGLIAGGAGVSAIETVTFLNTISKGTHFFNGIDMDLTPPPPPVPPVPSVLTADLSQIALPDGIAASSDYMRTPKNVMLDQAYCSKTPGSAYCTKIQAGRCKKISEYIVSCGG